MAKYRIAKQCHTSHRLQFSDAKYVAGIRMGTALTVVTNTYGVG